MVVTGQTAEAKPFTVAVPVDLLAAAPITLSAAPDRVVRGQTTHLTVTVTNRLSTAGQMSVAFKASSTAQFVLASPSVSVPASGTATFGVDLVLSASARSASPIRSPPRIRVL